jgi:hypothetical protein
MRATHWVIAGSIPLAACVSPQLGFETLDIGSTLKPMRSTQIMNNIAETINESDTVPNQFVISNGNANVGLNLGPLGVSLPEFNFSQHTKILTASVQNTVSGQWQFGSVNDPQDLQNLRGIYRLVVNTEIMPPWANADATITCILDSFAAFDVGIKQQILSGQTVAPSVLRPDNCYARNTSNVRPAVLNTGAVPTVYPTTADVIRIITKGMSLECQQYQHEKPATPPVLYRRWLFWKAPDGTWEPHAPPSEAELASVGTGLESIGTYGGHEFWLASRACYSDFVVLDLASTAAAHAAANSAVKVTTPPAP